jgi:hypothetical protein
MYIKNNFTNELIKIERWNKIKEINKIKNNLSWIKNFSFSSLIYNNIELK